MRHIHSLTGCIRHTILAAPIRRSWSRDDSGKETQLRIGISGPFWDKPLTGVGQYVRYLWHQLVSDASHDYLLLSEGHPAGLSPRYVRSMGTPFTGRRENLSKLWWEQITAPRIARHISADLIHCPYFAPPMFSLVPVVVTVHDVIPLIIPEYRGSPLIRAYMALVAEATRRSSLIITDSEASRDDVIHVLGVQPSKVHSVPLGVGEPYKRCTDNGVLHDLRRKYSLPQDFVFYVGGLDVRKNVPNLIRAFARVNNQNDRSWQLAIAGRSASPDRRLFPDLQAVVEEMNCRPNVSFLGVVPDLDKALLYSSCALFVFPSSYEGFGLPPLEAMACGAPVIACDSSSMPEVVGDAGMLVEPGSVDALAMSIKRVLADRDLREEMRTRGLQRASNFTWRRTVDHTLRLYERAACES
jgi:glycosyltransferase involved in cell wall biosynthesis